MIGRIYRLMDTKRIEMIQREVEFGDGMVLTKPDYLSICAADQRYYFGRRKREILTKKLPMALIHEATAKVLNDSNGKLKSGSKVVLVPLAERIQNSSIKGNYNPDNPYMSSGVDGFIRDYAALPPGMTIPVEENYSPIYVFSEIVSVALNALEAFENTRITDAKTVGVWGDGSLGYVTALTLRCLYPDIKLFVFGKTPRKLQRFSFADQAFIIDDVPRSFRADHCFECVGDRNSEDAIEQMLDIISPQGCVSLLGVSEEAVAIRTRTVLEKGLKLIGNNRSDANDMRRAAALISGNNVCRKYLTMLISEVVEVKSERDIAYAFEQSSLNDFKTVIKWEL